MTNLRYYQHAPVPYTGPHAAKVYVVGEAPGEEEAQQGEPFVGRAGDKLTQVLDRNGLPRASVRLCNLSSQRPWSNKFEHLLQTDILKQGVENLRREIITHKPTVVVALGNWPLYYLTGRRPISAWRGSIIPCIFDSTIKVIPTFHPAYVSRDATVYPIFNADIEKVKYDSEFREFRYPKYEWTISPDGMGLLSVVSEFLDADELAVDIETVRGSTTILCIGFAKSGSRAAVIVPDTESKRRAISRLLESDSHKIFQNGIFDTIQLKLNGFEVNNYHFDTRTAQHCLEPELPTSLAFTCSLYTRQPYYKSSGKKDIPGDEKAWSSKVDKGNLYKYNATDCCVTFAVYEAQKKLLARDADKKYMFDFEMSELELASHISMSGMLRDEQERRKIQKILINKWAKKQIVLDTLIGHHTNVRSPKLKDYLYGDKYLNLPARRKRGKGGESTITTDENAVVSLIAYCKSNLKKVSRADAVDRWKRKLASCKLVLEIRGIRQLLANYINARGSIDNRVRSIYNVSGPETGRWSCSKFVDGSGYNFQTNPRDPIEYDDFELGDNKLMLSIIGQLQGDIKQFKKLDFSDWEDSDDDEEAA